VREVDEGDNNVYNNMARATLSVRGTDLDFDVSASKTRAYQGDVINVICRVKNNGPENAQNVSVNLQLPANLQVQNVQVDRGTYSNGIWSIGDLADNETALLNITARIVSAGNFTVNTSAVSSAVDDSNPVNNDDTVVISAAVPKKGPQTQDKEQLCSDNQSTPLCYRQRQNHQEDLQLLPQEGPDQRTQPGVLPDRYKRPLQAVHLQHQLQVKDGTLSEHLQLHWSQDTEGERQWCERKAEGTCGEANTAVLR